MKKLYCGICVKDRAHARGRAYSPTGKVKIIWTCIWCGTKGEKLAVEGFPKAKVTRG
jgi:hypothetical protein